MINTNTNINKKKRKEEKYQLFIIITSFYFNLYNIIIILLY